MGRVIAPYGVKGWVKVKPYTETAESLAGYDRWWIGGPGRWIERDVAETAVHGGNLVARLEGCEERDEAATLRGAEIALARESLPATLEGEYYWADLQGLAVVNVQGEVLGEVAGLLETGANDVLRVRDGENERLIPFVEHVVRNVDLDGGRIEVDWGRDW